MSQTVLICDDAIFMRTMIGDILTQAGFQIVAEERSFTKAAARIGVAVIAVLIVRDGRTLLKPR